MDNCVECFEDTLPRRASASAPVSYGAEYQRMREQSCMLFLRALLCFLPRNACVFDAPPRALGVTVGVHSRNTKHRFPIRPSCLV